MIPFPGESLAVDSFENVSGTPIGSLSDITIRAGVSTFVTGAAAKVVVFFGFNYLESADTPGEVSWCVEVTGGAGSLTLTECLGDGTPDVPLGTFAVSGAGPLVVPSSAITVADVYDDFYGSLLIECDSGAVDVQQVKLRVFPVGGALGGWGDALHPAWDRTTNALAQEVSRQDGAEGVLSWGFAGPTSIGPGWTNTVALMPDARDPDHAVPVALGSFISSTDIGASDVRLTASSAVSPPPGESGGACLITGTGMLATRAVYGPDVNPAEGLIDGVDYIASPFEVWGDVGSFADADTDPVNSWVTTYDVGGSTLSLGEMIATEDQGGSDPPPDSPLIGALPWSPAGDDQLWPDNSAVTPEDLTLPDVDAVLIAPSHAWFRRDTAPTTPGVDFEDDYLVTRFNGFLWNFTAPLQYATAMPPYRVWNVDAAVVVTKLRQLHRDDGLGVAPPRAFGGASRIRTGRAYGYD